MSAARIATSLCFGPSLAIGCAPLTSGLPGLLGTMRALHRRVNQRADRGAVLRHVNLIVNILPTHPHASTGSASGGSSADRPLFWGVNLNDMNIPPHPELVEGRGHWSLHPPPVTPGLDPGVHVFLGAVMRARTLPLSFSAVRIHAPSEGAIRTCPDPLAGIPSSVMAGPRPGHPRLCSRPFGPPGQARRRNLSRPPVGGKTQPRA